MGHVAVLTPEPELLSIVTSQQVRWLLLGVSGYGTNNSSSCFCNGRESVASQYGSDLRFRDREEEHKVLRKGELSCEADSED